MAQQQSNYGCITYHLPDGDRTIISWEYVMVEINPLMSGLIIQLTAENSALDRIIARMQQWVGSSTT